MIVLAKVIKGDTCVHGRIVMLKAFVGILRNPKEAIAFERGFKTEEYVKENCLCPSLICECEDWSSLQKL